ncbi:MAG: thiamine phosphate synthase [Pedobacter sp.]
MSSQSFPYRLYLVVSVSDCKSDILHVVEEAIMGGVDLVQLREKNLSTEEYVSLALRLKAVTNKHDIPLLINDNLEVARRVNAHGIHVGNSDLPPTAVQKAWEDCNCIGYSIEYLKQLDNKEAHLAHYLGISPVFSTPTKTDTIVEWGLEGVTAIRQLSGKPLVAIGGMNISNVREVMMAGADCIAVVSAICAADDPRAAALELKTEILNAL